MTARQKEYESPFSARWHSPEMSHLFSAHHRAVLFRRLWLALAKGEKRGGLKISSQQIAEMKKGLEKIDFEAIEAYEKKFRHDVMAHIHAYGDVAPLAKPILHLGATSTYVTDNADLVVMKEAMGLLFRKLIYLLRHLASFTKKHAKIPCLGFTHFQSAQPTTIGKRASLWLQDFLIDAEEWERLLETLPFLGVKGATGTQSSFLSLFQGNESKVRTLEEGVAREFGFSKVVWVSGQTYTRKLDLQILNALGSFCSSAHKMATDIRLLAHVGEVAESFGKTQVGSSAMPYKRNPIYSERICGIARFVMSLTQNPAYTMATQWLERTLDDSSNRRLAIPEAFLGADAVLNLLCHMTSSLMVSPHTAHEKLKEQLPFLAMENILMAASQKGGDRQLLHEKLRQWTVQAQKQKDPLRFLIASVEKEEAFQLTKKEIAPLLSTKALIGRAPEQVALFLKEGITPFLRRHKKLRVVLPNVSF